MVVLVPRPAAGDGAVVGDVVGVVGEQRSERLGVGLNRTDLRCLDVVLGEGPVAAGRISAALKLSPAATTTVIDRLERAGMVSRSSDPGNRRRVLVAATEAARSAEAEIFLPVGRAGAEALRAYGADALATVLDFLRTARRVQEEQAARVRALP
ncbi:DNA-binding MarR family transcriptional regulator [Nonomuraea thailandensis]|uniref:DNA-binding MarR family transcriptional regulator n=1 Tax=Nonomuraea thailandensis TaxID=1188745 RepID=A0A9X2GTW4_9ACTN|nr:MarR family transcriptional regulator [Nonomuraea thailandensis]MCP2365444.1 DNA-binding MarR family transcriptional regulator [Nonomuraea thailandensis]